MKSIKTYLVIVSISLLLAIGAGIYVWYVYQKVQSDTISQMSAKKLY
jgi:uncharacterized protein HemX